MAFGPRRLLRESLPVAGLLFVWYVIGGMSSVLFELFSGILEFRIPPNVFPDVFETIAIGMAIVYVVVRGIIIARETEPFIPSGDPRDLLHESIVVAIPVLAWSVFAVIVSVFISLLFDLFGLRGVGPLMPGETVSPTFVTIFTQTALATVVLYIVVRITGILCTKHGLGTTTPADD